MKALARRTCPPPFLKLAVLMLFWLLAACFSGGCSQNGPAVPADPATIASNERSAVTTLRTLNVAEVTYASTYNKGFTDTLNRLGPGGGENHADLTDKTLAGMNSGASKSFTKDGYEFTYEPGGSFPSVSSYKIFAKPSSPGSSGERWFYTDQTVEIRGEKGKAAGPSSPLA